MTDKPITVVVADDQDLIIQGFKMIVHNQPLINVVAFAKNGEDLVAAVEQHRPQIAFVDIKMPVLNGIEATKIIKTKFPECQVLGLSNYDERLLITDMVEAGASGYLLKEARREEFMEAIEAVLEGRNYYCPKASKKILDNYKEDLVKEPAVEFTERELEIIFQICKDKTSRQIAKQLHISTRTVDTHRRNIQKKMGTHSIAGIVLYAIRHGLVGTRR